MRIIFMGNPQFAIPTLNVLNQSHHDLIGIVSNPPKPIGRGKSARSTAVGRFAKENSIYLIEVDSLRSNVTIEQIAGLNPDIFVIVAFKILPEKLLSLPKFGSINLHASLLPRYRGAGPIQWALMNGDKKTGVTIFQLRKEVDAGNILMQKEILINPEDDMLSLGNRISQEGAQLIPIVLDNIEEGKVEPITQDESEISFAPKITKSMSEIKWDWSNTKIHNWVRGLNPYPGMYTYFKGRRIRIHKTFPLEGQAKTPGQVMEFSKDSITISTGYNLLQILEIQVEGKRRMSSIEFINGMDIKSGDIFKK